MRPMLLLIALVLLPGVSLHAAEAPWGRAELMPIDYQPQRVVYDVAAKSEERFQRLLDRVSYLNTLYNADPFSASIVVVLHGDEIGFFAVAKFAEYEDLVRRAHSLTLNGPIEFRVCAAAARDRGFEPGDLHGFLTVVPMADAEIIRLQTEEDYAYMQ